MIFYNNAQKKSSSEKRDKLKNEIGKYIFKEISRLILFWAIDDRTK